MIDPLIYVSDMIDSHHISNPGADFKIIYLVDLVRNILAEISVAIKRENMSQ